MMLADHAQVADGKLFISGGGWSACPPGPTPCAVAVIFHVPWQETDEKVSFTLRLVECAVPMTACDDPEFHYRFGIRLFIDGVKAAARS